MFGEVRARDVQPSIAVIVGNGYPHSGQSHAILIQPAACRNRNLAKCSVVVIAIEQAGSAIARHVDIRPAVVVEVRSSSAHAVGPPGAPIGPNKDHHGRSSRVNDSRLLRDVLECPVSPIPVKNIRTSRETQRTTGNANLVVAAVNGVATLRRCFQIEIQVVRHKQIEMTIAVIVQETTTRAPTPFCSLNSGPRGCIGEGPVAIVVVEHVVSPISDEKILEAVIVIVTDTTALPPAGVRKT